MTFPSYPVYKDSGVEWQGAVPAEWPRSALKFLADYQNGYPFKPEDWGEEGLPIIRISQLTGDTAPNYYSGELDFRVKVGDGDLLFSWSATIDSFIWTGGAAWLNQHIFKVSPTVEADQKFLFYLIKLVAPKLADFDAHGSTMRHIKKESLSERLHVPTLVEQTQIARFLDHETARIDALIEEQQRLIELLKEKRQAVISHAVTKGLDPTVPMKDSGVEWLGEVPAHWKQIRIKHILNAMIDAEHKTAEYSDDGEYLVCRTTNVRNGLLSLEGAKYADRNTYIDWTRRGVPEPLDILFTREAPAGEACLVPENLEICLGQRMVLFKLDKTRIDPAFTVHSIYAGLASDFVKQLSQGSTVSHFNMADIGNIPLFEPPLPEQKEISDFLARRCDSYGLLINEAESSVKLISERRSALISAAVTGKIDVRGWQPQASAPSPELVQEAV